MKATLFDDDEEDAETTTALGVNQGYAARFEKRKRIQELAQLQSRHGTQPESESEESEDDDAELLTPDLDLKILETIDRIKHKRPEVYDSNAQWFEGGGEDDDDSEDEEDEDEDEDEDEEDGDNDDGARAGSAVKRKKTTLRDQLLSQGAEALASDSDDEGDASGRTRSGQPIAYDEEQRQLRRAFMDGAGALDKGEGEDEGEDEEEGDDAGDGGRRGELLSAKRAKQSEGSGLYGDLLRKKLAERREEAAAADGANASLSQYLTASGQGLDSDERFLRDYVVNARWKGAEGEDEGGWGAGAVDGVDEEEPEREGGEGSEGQVFSDQEDDFERTYNFRFEEAGAGAVTGHARHAGDSLRRQAALARKQEAETERKARRAAARGEEGAGAKAAEKPEETRDPLEAEGDPNCLRIRLADQRGGSCGRL